MHVDDPYGRLIALDRPRGGEQRTLTIGRWSIRLRGLDASLAADLDRRWGPFLEHRVPPQADRTVRVVSGGTSGWLASQRGEPYRLERRGAARRAVIVSHNFALAAEDPRAAVWRLALIEQGQEPAQRMVENASRFLVAGLALAAGGFAMHGAGVLAHGRAHLYAGPSGAGKSTAVRLSAPARSLGDDFALVLPTAEGWCAAAVPFDNAERIPADAPRGLFPVSGVWRLHHGRRTSVEQPPPAVAHAALLGAAAFPWAFPEQTDALLEHVRRFVAEARFGHLFFGLDSDLWNELIRAHGNGRVDFADTSEY